MVFTFLYYIFSENSVWSQNYHVKLIKCYVSWYNFNIIMFYLTQFCNTKYNIYIYLKKKTIFWSVIAIVSLMVATMSYSAQSFPKQHFQPFKLLIWNTQSIQSFSNTCTIYLYSPCKQLCHLRAVQTDREHYDVYWNRRTDSQPVKQIQG